jgi:hypothetical protein
MNVLETTGKRTRSTSPQRYTPSRRHRLSPVIALAPFGVHALTALTAVISVSIAPGCSAGPHASELTLHAASTVATRPTSSTLKETHFSDANGWNQPQYYSSIHFPDVNHDGRSDVCGRSAQGIVCATDDHTGNLVNYALWNGTFSDAAGWSAAPYYYDTIAFPDLDGDGKADVCGRGGGGIYCALSDGSSFQGGSIWSSHFNDANRWAGAAYYTTIAYPDVNGDGKADVCGRGPEGVWCALSNGTSFGPATLWDTGFFGDAQEFGFPQFYETLKFPDVNGDGKADVCARGIAGVYCALSDGVTGFWSVALYSSTFSDAAGWSQPQYYETIQYSDIDKDGKQDICGRSPPVGTWQGGLACALSTGTSFGPASKWDNYSTFSDYHGWSDPSLRTTMRFQSDALCARGVSGVFCAFSTFPHGQVPTYFYGTFFESSTESNENGWAQPQYYSTIALTADMKIAGRGAAGIYTSPPVAPPPPYVQQSQLPDEITIQSTSDLLARRTALITRVWGRSTIDTTQGVDSDTVITQTDVQPPPNVTVHRYTINMPTVGGAPKPGGPAYVQGLADHFIPAGGSKKLVILNPGHTCNYGAAPFQDTQAVLELLAEGYAVLATYMPIYTPLECVWNSLYPRSHNDLFDPSMPLRPANDGDPFIYFLDPVRRSLNYAIAQYGYTSIAMMGLSGGGWTTTVYAALDTRITSSVPIAGSEPLYMNIAGDIEGQDAYGNGNDFYSLLGDPVVTHYKDLYVMGAHGAGRRQTQVLNRNDNEGFGESKANPIEYVGTGVWDQTVRAYELEVRQKLQALGAGAYRVEINEADDCVVIGNCICVANPTDPSCNNTQPVYYQHEFSKSTRVSVMLAEADGADALVAASGTTAFGRGVNGNLSHSNGAGAWTDTGLPMVGTPAVISGAIPGHVYDVFYRDPFNTLTHAYYDGSSWKATSDLWGRVISDPAAVSWGAGRIDVAAIGTDYSLHHWSYSGAWSAGDLVSGTWTAVGQLAITSAGPGQLDILFRGVDATLHHARSNGAPPYSLEATTVAMKGFPAATSTSGVLKAFVTGTDDTLLFGQSTSAGAWSWTNVTSTTGTTSTKVHGSPSAFASASDSASVYARVDGAQTSQLGRYTLASGIWTFTDLAGAASVGSPAATAHGALTVDATSAGVWESENPRWVTLGGAVNR